MNHHWGQPHSLPLPLNFGIDPHLDIRPVPRISIKGRFEVAVAFEKQQARKLRNQRNFNVNSALGDCEFDL